MITAVITFFIILILLWGWFTYKKLIDRIKKLENWQDGFIRYGLRSNYIIGDTVVYRAMNGSLKKGKITSIHNNHVGLPYYFINNLEGSERVLETQILLI